MPILAAPFFKNKKEAPICHMETEEKFLDLLLQQTVE